jgi:hypothetical protein
VLAAGWCVLLESLGHVLLAPPPLQPQPVPWLINRTAPFSSKRTAGGSFALSKTRQSAPIGLGGPKFGVTPPNANNVGPKSAAILCLPLIPPKSVSPAPRGPQRGCRVLRGRRQQRRRLSRGPQLCGHPRSAVPLHLPQQWVRGVPIALAPPTCCTVNPKGTRLQLLRHLGYYCQPQQVLGRQ